MKAYIIPQIKIINSNIECILSTSTKRGHGYGDTNHIHQPKVKSFWSTEIEDENY